MAKLVDVHMSRVSNTMCPGTDAYMPPEAIDNQAVYTEKGDVFSFGVNIIQILTRKFPKPGDRFKTVTSSDPQFPSGKVEMRVAEIERHNNHISEINTAHPLLPIALVCLKNQEGERPSSGELCQRLAALKDTPEYTESERAVEDRRTTQQTSSAERDRQITKLRQQLLTQQREHDQQIQQSQGAFSARQQEHDQQIQQSQGALRARQQEIQDLREELSTAQTTVREKEQLIEAKDMQLESKEHVFERLQQQSDQTQEVIQDLREELNTAQATVREKEQIITTRDCQQRDHEEMIAQFQRRIEELELNSRPQPRAQSLSHSDIARATPPTQPPRGHHPAQHPTSTSTGEGVIRLNWTQGRKAPCKMYRSNKAVVDGSVAYFRPGETEQVHAYNSTTDTWSQLPDCRTEYTTLAIVNGLLTTVGGKVGGNNSNKLFSLTGEGRERKWTEVFPPMTTKRYFVIAVTTGRALIVAGGEGDRHGDLATVEIMNTDTRQWSTAADLPKAMVLDSATVCGECIYMCEGKSVITCFLPALLQSRRPMIFEAQPSTPSPQGPIWFLVADFPVKNPTLVSINNRLLAIGGCDSNYKPTTAVPLYDPVNNSWQTISHLSTPRRWCFAIVLPDNRIMVVGGFTTQSLSTHSITNTVEFSNIQ